MRVGEREKGRERKEGKPLPVTPPNMEANRGSILSGLEIIDYKNERKGPRLQVDRKSSRWPTSCRRKSLSKRKRVCLLSDLPTLFHGAINIC